MFLFVFIVFMIPLMGIVYFFIRCFKFINIIVDDLKNLIFWDGTLQMFLESYIEVTFSALTVINLGLSWDNTFDTMRSLVAILSITLYSVLPFIVSSYFFMKFNKFGDKNFHKKYKETIEKLNQRTRFSGVFFAMFCYRRLLLVINIMYIGQHNYFQI